MAAKFIILLLLFSGVWRMGLAQDTISRKELKNIDLGKKTVTLVKVVEIEFPAGQKAPRHRHPCPVVGRILSGTCFMQVEGEAPRKLATGDVFYEPAGAVIAHFDKDSQRGPLKFIAYYLTDRETALTELLKAAQEK